MLQPNLERDIVESDIDNTHIYRTKKNFDPNSSKQLVIIKFVSVLRRDDVYSNKKFLKDKNVSLTEHLTKTNLFIYKAAQKAVSDIKKVWTHYGTTLVDLHGKIRAIRSLEDVERIIKNPHGGRYHYRHNEFPPATTSS